MNSSFQRHFCVTSYTVRPEDGKFLFIKHRKLNKWLPPGGHVDPNERPDEAALRECLEETGIHGEIVSLNPNIRDLLPSAFAIQLNVIQPNEHEHMDLIYLIAAYSGQKELMNMNETDGTGWFSAEEILCSSFDTFDTVKEWVGFFESFVEQKGILQGVKK